MGKVVSGKLEADSEAAVASKLKQMGYAPLSISKHKAGMSTEIKIPGLSGRIKLKDLAIMARQFAVMINSGLSLLRALNILSEQTENKELGRILGEVRNDVETGTALSAALGKHPKAFPPLMVNMIMAGEVGGFLDSVLLQIAENYEAEVKLRGKVKSAMTYPVVVFVIAILAVVGMLLFIVPVFATMFEDLGGELPAPTKVLVFLSGAMKVAAPIGLVGFILFLATWGKVKQKDAVRNVLDPLKLKLPIFGGLTQKIALSRFSRNLGTMMRCGVPILQSLDIVAATTGNVVLERAIRDVQESVRSGESLAKPLENADGGADDVRRRGDRCPGHDAAQDLRLLRRRGGSDHGGPHVADRAPDDRRPRQHHRSDDHRAVHADLQRVQPDQRVVQRSPRRQGPEPRRGPAPVVRPSPFGLSENS